MVYSTTVSAKGQIVIPKVIREMIGLKAGDLVKVSLDQDKRVVVELDDDVRKMMGAFAPRVKRRISEKEIDEIIMEEVSKKYE